MNHNRRLRLLKKYEPLIKYYSTRVWGYEEIGMEKEDVEQDMRLKVWNGLETHWVKFLKFTRTKRQPPVPLDIWVKTLLVNYNRDLIRKLNVRRIECEAIRVEHSNIEISKWYGEESILSDVKNYNINGVDLLENMSGKEKLIFKMYLKGLSKTKISKVFKRKGVKFEDIKDIINKQIDYLYSFKDELINQTEEYCLVV